MAGKSARCPRWWERLSTGYPSLDLSSSFPLEDCLDKKHDDAKSDHRWAASR
jgi:hypothetical protein